MPGGRRHAPLDNPGLFVKLGIRYEFRYFGVSGSVCPRDEQAVTAGDDGLGDEGHLFGGLALTKHDLGKPLAVGAVVVHSGESEILEWLASRRGQIQGAAFGVRRIEPALAHRIEERAQRVQGTEGMPRVFLHELPFDSAESPYLELRIVPRRSLIL
jgi:hypothetical protein